MKGTVQPEAEPIMLYASGKATPMLGPGFGIHRGFVFLRPCPLNIGIISILP